MKEVNWLNVFEAAKIVMEKLTYNRNVVEQTIRDENGEYKKERLKCSWIENRRQ